MKSKSVLLLSVAMLVPVVLGGCPLLQRGETVFWDITFNTMNATRFVGDHLVVALPSNGSTGYSWQVTTIDTSMLELVQQQSLATGTSDLPGSGSMSVFEFLVTGKGSSTLVLDSVRAGDPPGTPPAQTFSMSFLVE